MALTNSQWKNQLAILLNKFSLMINLKIQGNSVPNQKEITFDKGQWYWFFNALVFGIIIKNSI